MPVLIEKLLPDGSRSVLASFNDAAYAASRLDRYGPPGTCALREVDETEARAALKKGDTRAADIRAARAAPGNYWGSKGEKRPKSKLTDEKVREIRRRAKTESRAALAAAFGVSVPTIFAVVTRKSWTHV